MTTPVVPNTPIPVKINRYYGIRYFTHDKSRSDIIENYLNDLNYKLTINPDIKLNAELCAELSAELSSRLDSGLDSRLDSELGFRLVSVDEIKALGNTEPFVDSCEESKEMMVSANNISCIDATNAKMREIEDKLDMLNTLRIRLCMEHHALTNRNISLSNQQISSTNVINNPILNNLKRILNSIPKASEPYILPKVHQWPIMCLFGYVNSNRMFYCYITLSGVIEENLVCYHHNRYHTNNLIYKYYNSTEVECIISTHSNKYIKRDNTGGIEFKYCYECLREKNNNIIIEKDYYLELCKIKNQIYTLSEIMEILVNIITNVNK